MYLLFRNAISLKRGAIHTSVLFTWETRAFEDAQAAVRGGTSLSTTLSVAHRPLLMVWCIKVPILTSIARPILKGTEGYCGGIASGKVRVGFQVANCKAYPKSADALTRWNAISRIIIEEVEPPVL